MAGGCARSLLEVKPPVYTGQRPNGCLTDFSDPRVISVQVGDSEYEYANANLVWPNRCILAPIILLKVRFKILKPVCCSIYTLQGTFSNKSFVLSRNIGNHKYDLPLADKPL